MGGRKQVLLDNVVNAEEVKDLELLEAKILLLDKYDTEDE